MNECVCLTTGLFKLILLLSSNATLTTDNKVHNVAIRSSLMAVEKPNSLVCWVRPPTRRIRQYFSNSLAAEQ